MTRERIAVLVIVWSVVFAVPVLGATWTKVGTSAFTGDTVLMQDHQRFGVNDIVIDDAGNIYMTASRQSNGGDSSGVTIFKPGGTVLNVNLTTAGYPGAVQKLVLAGDGSVYGVQNWLEIGWNFSSGVNSRILRINPDGSVDRVHELTEIPQGQEYPNRIEGFCVGDDGNIYFVLNGQDNTRKYNLLWRYKVVGSAPLDVIEPSPMNGSVNNGWSQGDRFFNLVNVGNGWLGLVHSGGASWSLTAISWSDFRRTVNPNGVADPGWGRSNCTDVAWDPVRNVLWGGARGRDGRLILSRWIGGAGNPSLFTIPTGSATDPAPGVTQVDVWHGDQDADLGNRWISALAIDPTSGDALMGFAGSTTYNYGLRGHVVRHDGARVQSDEGMPESGADITALHVLDDGTMLAAVMNLTTGAYSLYTSGELEPPCDSDIDGDLICDDVEAMNNPVGSQTNALLSDSDGDGLSDGVEDANRNGVVDAGETQARNRDSDGDGVEDGLELKSSSPSNPLNAADPASFVDNDNDGLGAADDPDDSKPDTDGDGYADRFEFVVLGLAAVTNANVKPTLGDLNLDTSVSNLDALLAQALFLGNVTPANGVFHPGGIEVGGYVNGDINRDGFISNVDALMMQAFFLGNLAIIPF